MPPDQLLLYAFLMPASAGIALLLLPSSPWARIQGDDFGAVRRETWLSGAACGLALCASLVVTDGWPWSAAWSSWKLIYASAAIVAVAGAIGAMRIAPRAGVIALGAAAAVLWYRVPEAKDLGPRAVAAAIAAAVALVTWRCARRSPSWSCAAAAAQAFTLAVMLGLSGSSKVGAAAAALGLTLAAGAVATRASRTFSCAAAASLAGGGFGVALSLYGRGYHDGIPPWAWCAVAVIPALLCAPGAFAPAPRKAE